MLRYNATIIAEEENVTNIKRFGVYCSPKGIDL